MGLKIGNRELILAKRVDTSEVGVTGTGSMALGGNIVLTEEDYNPDLRGQAFYDQVDRMRLSDSQVRAVMSILKLPLLAANWRIEPASDEAKDKEIAEWLEIKFFQNQLRSWDYILRHMLLSLDFGVMPFEMVWEVEDDDVLKRPMVHLAKLAPRMPRSIMQWNLRENGLMDSIIQLDVSGQYKQITIPGDKLLMFVHEMEGANYKGTSILRQARKDWYIKERLQRINQVAIEKRAAGIDVGTLPEGANTTQKGAFESVLQTIRTHERAYVLEPEGHKYRIEGISGNVLDPLPSIEYCDVQILRSILADFLVSGTSSERGALAMVKDRSSFFLMSLGAIANELMAPINRNLIPQWVNYNWPNVNEYPQITHSRLERRDVGTTAEALKNLIPIGAITPDNEIEREVRELLEMPDMPENGEELARLAKQDDKGLMTAYRKSKVPRRPATISSIQARTPLEKSVDWMALKRGLDDAEDKIVNAYKSVQDRQVSKIVDEAMKAVTADKPADERADMLENINIPYKREITAAIGKVLADLYGFGQREVKQEMARQGGEPIRLAAPLDAENDSVIKRFLKFRAAFVVSVLSNRLRGSLLNNGLNMIREGDTDRLMLWGTISSLSDRAIKSAAGETVSEALNLGRESVAKRNKNLVEEVVYSAILDDGVCTVCAGLNGNKYEFGSEEYEDAKPPRPSGGAISACFGRNRCRCLFIFKFTSEAKPRG